MKKFLLALMLAMITCSCSFGAESEDVYVRKDLFEVHKQNINAKLDKIDAKLEKIDHDAADLNVRIIKVETRIDVLEKRFDDLRIVLRIAFVGLIGMIFGVAIVRRC